MMSRAFSSDGVQNESKTNSRILDDTLDFYVDIDDVNIQLKSKSIFCVVSILLQSQKKKRSEAKNIFQ